MSELRRGLPSHRHSYSSTRRIIAHAIAPTAPQMFTARGELSHKARCGAWCDLTGDAWQPDAEDACRRCRRILEQDDARARAA